jgi:ribosome-associated translation inhibitor RaiA
MRVTVSARHCEELRLHTSRGAVLVGRGSAGAHRSAFDQAMARVRRQLDRTPGRNGRATQRRAAARAGR